MLILLLRHQYWFYATRRSRAERDVVVCLCAGEGAGQVIVRVAVGAGAGLLEDLSVMAGPAGLRGAVRLRAAVLRRVEGSAGTLASYRRATLHNLQRAAHEYMIQCKQTNRFLVTISSSLYTVVNRLPWFTLFCILKPYIKSHFFYSFLRNTVQTVLKRLWLCG
jgi:hypothetical protein